MWITTASISTSASENPSRTPRHYKGTDRSGSTVWACWYICCNCETSLIYLGISVDQEEGEFLQFSLKLSIWKNRIKIKIKEFKNTVGGCVRSSSTTTFVINSLLDFTYYYCFSDKCYSAPPLLVPPLASSGIFLSSPLHNTHTFHVIVIVTLI